MNKNSSDANAGCDPLPAGLVLMVTENNTKKKPAIVMVKLPGDKVNTRD